MPSVQRPSWSALRNNLCCLAATSETNAQRLHRYWHLLRDHPWVDKEARKSVAKTPENSAARDELAFQLARQLVMQSGEEIAKLTLREFCHMLKSQRSVAAKLLEPLATFEIVDLRALVEVQRAIDCLSALPRTALTLRSKGISIERGAALLRVSTFAFYSAWREGALEIRKNLHVS